MTSDRKFRIYLSSGSRNRKLLPVVWLIILAADHKHAGELSTTITLIFSFFAVMIAFLCWQALFERLEATSGGIRHVNLFKRDQWDLSWSNICSYSQDVVGTWRLVSDEKPYDVSRFQTAELHFHMIRRARHALKGVLLRQKHLPPKEDFVNLWAIDLEEFFDHVAGFLGTCAYCLIVNPGWAVPALLIVLLLFILQESFNRISITDQGISRESLFGKTDFLWKDVDAVFRERRKYSRGFTVIAGDKAIFVPPKLCENVELVRKLLFSLPEGTLMVNFKGKIPRRPRRRIRKRLPLRRPKQEALQPTF